ncbi:MAG TPA: 5,6-dimethylbenzimidazole synthase, partial [Thalassobaculum sp.]
VGWVSILDPDRLGRDLAVPPAWRLAAYLCLGRPEEEHADPELERAGWQARTGRGRELERR